MKLGLKCCSTCLSFLLLKKYFREAGYLVIRKTLKIHPLELNLMLCMIQILSCCYIKLILFACLTFLFHFYIPQDTIWWYKMMNEHWGGFITWFVKDFG